MVDFKAGVRVTARHCFMLETLSVHARPSLLVRRGLGYGTGTGTVVSNDTASASLAGSSPLAMSTSVVQDSGRNNSDGDVMGVTQSVNTRLNGKLKATGKNGRKEEEKKKREGNGKRSVRDDGEDVDEEVQFGDEMWDRLLGKGYICGDERWLIGEDREGSVTIVRF